MTINWDCDQLVFLAEAIEAALPLQGTLRVVTSRVPKNSFAGKVVPNDSEFRLYLSLDDCLADSAINLALGYTLLYAYEREGWAPSISLEELEAAHSEVCSLLNSINKGFSDSVRSLLDILHQWHKAETEHGSALKEDEFTAICATEEISESFQPAVKDYGAN